MKGTTTNSGGEVLDSHVTSRFCLIQHYSARCIELLLQKGRGKPIKWHNIKCARQTGNTECRYYVMKFIWEIITSVGSSDIAQVWNAKTEPYTTEEFDDIRKVWAIFFVDEVL
ncbi:unnamed protein product [Cuscuta europaea]|uniref:Uncharacterized protein n=1 Tax=Cuscuta europaea TaxID=41803 RepID=A0A9P0ZS29_CUSEU|nr:unnamed protein product [Cuscuta europaea]